MGTLTSMVTGKMRTKFEFPIHTSASFSSPSPVTTPPSSGFRNDPAVAFRVVGVQGVAGLVPPSSEFIMGAWVQFDGMVGDTSFFSGWSWDPGPPIDMADWRVPVGIGYAQGDGQVQVWSDATGPWVGAAANTLRATASSRLFNGIWYRRQHWHHVGAYFKQTGSDLDCSLYIDGHQFITYSGAGVWLTMPDAFCCGKPMHTSSGWTNLYFESFYMMDVTGEGDQIPPALRGMFTHVDGAGTTTQWTPKSIANWDEVDDTNIAPDEDTTYVETAASGNLDLYTHEALVAITDLPYSYTIFDAILVESFAENVDQGEATQISYQHVIDVAASQSTDGSFSNATLDAYIMHQSIFSGQPDASAWNLVDYNAAEFGYNSL